MAEQSQFDHTQLDLFVLDDDMGLPLGRPYLTACTDAVGHAIRGAQMSFQSPNFRGCSRMLKQALRRSSRSKMKPGGGN